MVECTPIKAENCFVCMCDCIKKSKKESFIKCVRAVKI